MREAVGPPHGITPKPLATLFRPPVCTSILLKWRLLS